MKYETIILDIDNYIATITLNRPDRRNAINNILVNDLTDAFFYLEKQKEIRCIIITGAGSSFCSGVDIKWLKEYPENSEDDNFKESLKLTELLFLINEFPKPVIAMVNGPAVGGGVGIMLASDIVIAVDDMEIGLSEVSKGIVPAAIIPFLLQRMSESKAREYLITGQRISSKYAKEIGLINYICTRAELKVTAMEYADMIIKNGPRAIRIVKEMITKTKKLKGDDLKQYIAQVIAELRKSDEGQAGMKNFLKKNDIE